MVCCRNDRFYAKPLIAWDPDDPEHNLPRGDSENAEWPNMCTIWEATYSTSRNKRVIRKNYVCGASLISKGAVLTTAHNIQ